WWFGFLAGFGALLGDLVESFIKRQLGFKSGELFFPWDKIDFVIGAFALTWWIWWPGWWAVLFLLVLSAGLSEAAHIAGYKLGLCKDKR
ncbi:CDP-archaeol synthase, partial [Candidatus Woesearchaeota archaeon]|nr:CDP-archaeol synthase [Candidatus Woesearchaeota archaeon]